MSSTNQISNVRSFWTFLTSSWKASLAILGSYGGIGLSVAIFAVEQSSSYLTVLLTAGSCVVLLLATYKIWSVKFREVTVRDGEIVELKRQKADLEQRLINEPTRADQFTSNFYKNVTYCQSIAELLDTMRDSALEDLRTLHGFISCAMYVPRGFSGSSTEEDPPKSLKAYTVIRKGSRKNIKEAENALDDKEQHLVDDALPRRPLQVVQVNDAVQRSYWVGAIPIAPPDNGDFWGVLVVYAHCTQENSYEVFTAKLRDLKQRFLDLHLAPTFKYIWDIQQRAKALDGLFQDGFVERRFYVVLNNLKQANDGNIHFDPDTSVVDRANASEFREALNTLKNCGELLRRVVQGEEGVVSSHVQENDRRLYVSLLPLSPGPAAAGGKRVLAILDRDFNNRYTIKVEANWDVLTHMLKQMSWCERDPDTDLWNQAALYQHIDRYIQGSTPNVEALGVFLLEAQASNCTRETKRAIAQILHSWLSQYDAHPLQLAARHDGLRYAITTPVREDKVGQAQALALVSLLRDCPNVQAIVVGVTVIESKVGLLIEEVLTHTFEALNTAQNTPGGIYVQRLKRAVVATQDPVMDGQNKAKPTS